MSIYAYVCMFAFDCTYVFLKYHNKCSRVYTKCGFYVIAKWVKFRCLEARAQFLKRALEVSQLPKQEVLSVLAKGMEDSRAMTTPQTGMRGLSLVILQCSLGGNPFSLPSFSTTGLGDEKRRFISFYCLSFLFKYVVRQRKLLQTEEKRTI